MKTAQRTYRGVVYDSTKHESMSNACVDHVYRGKHYQAPLNHEAVQPKENLELHYRGSVYQQRQQDACEIKS